MRELNDKQAAFVREYVVDKNGKQAIHADTGKPFADVKHGDKEAKT